ncbi:MAG: PIG-L family deacetylase [Candidatus Competibacteraceae bacterium]|nr:PIG-L family deacetylase [Candidatus Competibacteraceae bacterium]
MIPYHAVQTLGTGGVLVLAPHPDDEVFGCAGAIMRHVAAGDPVTVIVLTDGAGFQGDDLERQNYAAQRRQESRAAAAILGYGEPQFWEYRDRELVYGEPLVQRLRDAVLAAEARWLYAPSPYELHPDHRNLALAALEVARRLGGALTLALYEIGAPLPPNRLLDISAVWERKRQAIACFTSQLATQAYDRHVEALNRYRTYTLPREVEAAEAYWVLEGGEVTGMTPNVVLEPLTARHAEAARTDQEWRARYEEMLASRSWRLTKPLRDGAWWLRAGRSRLAAMLARG